MMEVLNEIMIDVLEKAKQYYPRLWSKDRLKALVNAGRLSKEEYEQIVGESYE